MKSVSIEDLKDEFLRELIRRGGKVERPSKQDHTGKNFFDALADCFGLSEDERRRTYRSSNDQYAWDVYVRDVKNRLKNEDFIERKEITGTGNWQITEAGREYIEKLDASKSPRISKAKSLIEEKVDPVDLSEPPSRMITTVSRIIRDTKKTNELKRKYKYYCQVCKRRISISESIYYAEVHHIQPLGGGHNGLDLEENMIVLCPNHHAMFDFGIPQFLSNEKVRIRDKEYELLVKHKIGDKSINYHNKHIWNSIS
ncbi:MAG: winged helix-turn-helix domain-containing protein [Leptolyngbyaceae cyanobacterium bins.302]|nr:winged helix-turn-helix domain-containing protein [Leptolyngbyaceae cyanobacterium bins.302]